MSCWSLHSRQLAGLFGNELGDVLLLVTSRSVRPLIALDPSDRLPIEEIDWTGPPSRAPLLARLDALRSSSRSASVLWIADDEFEHYTDEEIAGCKVAAISGFSAPLGVETLARTLRLVTETDYALETRLEKAFLEELDDAARIVFVSERFGTRAVFEHQTVEHWFSLHGALGWGQQVVLPTGELSALVNESGAYEDAARFALDGEVVLFGQPIVHRGGHEVSLEQTARAYANLASMRSDPVIASIERGVIVGLRSAVPASNAFLSGLSGLFSADERYRKIHEIGFGTHRGCNPLVDGNYFPNERYPGVHLGIGLGSYTQFHVDLVSTEIETRFEHEGGRTVPLYPLLAQVAVR